jgi:hypothetical protein
VLRSSPVSFLVVRVLLFLGRGVVRLGCWWTFASSGVTVRPVISRLVRPERVAVQVVNLAYDSDVAYTDKELPPHLDLRHATGRNLPLRSGTATKNSGIYGRGARTVVLGSRH